MNVESHQAMLFESGIFRVMFRLGGSAPHKAFKVVTDRSCLSGTIDFYQATAQFLIQSFIFCIIIH